MQVLIGVVLAAIGLTGGASQREQTQAAAALWQIRMRVQAVGDFRTADGEQVASVITDDHGFGSGFMVSSDGYMLTADHVVNPVDIARDTCAELKKGRTTAVARLLRVDFILRDIVENTAVGRIHIRPSKKSRDICANPETVVWGHDRSFPFRIVAREPSVDLALLKLDLQDAAFIPTGVPALGHGDPLYALGWVEPERFTKVTGIFIWGCEQVSDIEQGDGTADLNKYLFLRMFVPVREGMSGGPLMSGAALAGVTTVSAEFQKQITRDDGTVETVTAEGGYAVPAAYVHAWYLWASGKSKVKPSVVCTDPYIEKESPSTAQPRHR